LAAGSLFGENYYPNSESNDASNKISASVRNSVDALQNVVAPGTKSDKGMTLSVNGTPEVAYEVTYATPDDSGFENETIWLKTGEYGVMVKSTSVVTEDNYEGYYVLVDGIFEKAIGSGSSEYYELHDTVEVTANSDKKGTYNPVEWTVKDNNVISEPKTYREVSDIAKALETAFTSSGAPNIQLNKSYTITWEWKFDQGQNGADTILGNLMADTDADNYVVVKTSNNYVSCSELDENDYNLNIGFGATITVEQVN